MAGALALLALLTLAMIPASASAFTTHPRLGFSPVTGSGTGVTFHTLSGIAVDETSGNVFLNDGSDANAVDILGSEGGVPSGVVSPYQLTGFAFNNEPSGAAVDNSATSSSNGTLYITDVQNHVVRMFVRNPGTELYEAAGELTVSDGPALHEPLGVAVDSHGNVFVADYGSRSIVKFSPAGVQLARIGTEDSVGLPSSIAVDSADNLFVQGYGNGVVYKYTANGSGEVEEDVFTQVVDAGATGVAVDSGTNSLYVALGDHIAEYDGTTGSLRGEFGLGTLASTERLAVNSATGYIYVTDRGNTNVIAFGPGIKIPGVIADPPTEITGRKATLNATVNPDGLAVSECKFEYGPTAAYGSTKACEGTIPADSDDHSVTALVTGLLANSTYHFRVVAAGASGANSTFDRTFTTNPPAVTNAATGVSGTKATLNGIVFPEDVAVSECKFEYGISAAYGATVPCEGAIPADDSGHAVTAGLTHLTPNGATYHFRLVISGGTGIEQGEDMTLATEDTVTTGAATAIVGATVTLNGTVNPEGIPYTECAFEYGPATTYGTTVPCSESPTNIGTGTSAVSVHADLGELKLANAYHYRLVATNIDGTAKGVDQIFKTPGAEIQAEWAASVDSREAILKARINPMGAMTTFHIEYGTDTSYGSSTSEVAVGSDETGHIVTSLLEGLTPGTAYHWRVAATNPIGVSEGPDRIFNTPKLSAANQECTNEAFRTGASAMLPDCRAYEMVSPVAKNDTDIYPPINVSSQVVRLDQAATSGEKLTYTTSAGFGDTKGVPYASQYIASRATNGWTNHSITPSQGVSPAEGGIRVDLEFSAFTGDLCSATLAHTTAEPLAPGAPKGFFNLYRRQNCGVEGYEAVTTSKPPNAPSTRYAPVVQGLSGDGRCTVFYAEDQLTPDANPGSGAGTDFGGSNDQLYEACEGQLRLVSVLPNGEANQGDASVGTSNFGYGFLSNSSVRAVSANGARIYWTAAVAGPGSLYLRENAGQPQSQVVGGACTEASKACTIAISDGGTAHFWSASSNGSKALFTVSEGSSTLEGGKGDLYEFDLSTKSSTLIASKMLGVIGASEDVSRVSFVSEEVLTPGANAEGRVPIANERNLYLFDSTKQGSDRFRFIGILSGIDASNYFTSGEVGGIAPTPINLFPVKKTSRVSTDGRQIAFMSNASLTGYDNTDADTGEPDAEVFAYDATANGGGGQLRCVSCNPNGQRPSGRNLKVEGYVTNLRAAALLPPYMTELYGSRVISEDGSRVFFNSYDALAPADTNGKADVYQWEAPGTGGCSKSTISYSPLNEGCLNLISSGESPADSEFIDASADGRDVFFTTGSSLLPQDPGLIDIYDARAGGGYPPPPGQPAACEGEACQGAPAPPADPTPASSAFEGAGNVRSAEKKKHRKRKAHQKKRRHQHQHRANNHRRTPR